MPKSAEKPKAVGVGTANDAPSSLSSIAVHNAAQQRFTTSVANPHPLLYSRLPVTALQSVNFPPVAISTRTADSLPGATNPFPGVTVVYPQPLVYVLPPQEQQHVATASSEAIPATSTGSRIDAYPPTNSLYGPTRYIIRSSTQVPTKALDRAALTTASGYPSFHLTNLQQYHHYPVYSTAAAVTLQQGLYSLPYVSASQYAQTAATRGLFHHQDPPSSLVSAAAQLRRKNTLAGKSLPPTAAVNFARNPIDYSAPTSSSSSSSPSSSKNNSNNDKSTIGVSAFRHTSKQRLRKNRRGLKYKNDSFPMKLHRLLMHLHEHKQTHIATFSDDGSQFHILDKIALERDCLPQFFRHGNFKSFKRLLYMYGFQRTSMNDDNNNNGIQESYRHADFTRDNPDKCKDMLRKNSTAEQMRQYASPPRAAQVEEGQKHERQQQQQQEGVPDKEELQSEDEQDSDDTNE